MHANSNSTRALPHRIEIRDISDLLKHLSTTLRATTSVELAERCALNHVSIMNMVSRLKSKGLVDAKLIKLPLGSAPAYYLVHPLTSGKT